MVFQQRCSVSRANSFVRISQDSQFRERSHETEQKPMVNAHGAPRGRKAYIKWVAAWFAKGIVDDTAITTAVSYSLQRDNNVDLHS